jgi:AcrR family transcriptional regulator
MRRNNTKNRILEKATDLFYEGGFVKASIRDIVNAVGVTNSTVYIHFKNKDEILYSIIEEIGSTLLRELKAAVKSKDDPVEALREMIYRQVCLIKEKRKQIKIYMEEQYQLPPKLKKESLRQHREIYRIYYDRIREIEKRGLLGDYSPALVTFSIFAMMNWAYRWFKENRELQIEEVAEQIIRLFFSGMFGKGGRPA